MDTQLICNLSIFPHPLTNIDQQMRSKMPHVSNAKVRTRTPTSIPDKSLEMLLPRGQRDPSTKVFLPPKVPQKLHGFCLVLYPFYPPLTASKFATEKRPFCPGKDRLPTSNHPFSGAKMLVSGRVNQPTLHNLCVLCGDKSSWSFQWLQNEGGFLHMRESSSLYVSEVPHVIKL